MLDSCRLSKLLCLVLFFCLSFGGIIFKPDYSIKQKDFYGVGIIEGPNTLGSCVVIGDGSWIITAAHVLPEYETAFYIVNFPYLDPYEYVVHSIYIHPTQDLAICRLNRRAPRAYEILSVKPPLNSVFYSGGYGRGSNGTDINTVKYEVGPGELIVFKNTIEHQNEDPITGSSFDIYDLSCPERASTLSGEGILGPGDSGGGNFIYKRNKPVLIGISVSMGFTEWNGEVARYGSYISIVEVKDWIDSIIPKEVERDFY